MDTDNFWENNPFVKMTVSGEDTNIIIYTKKFIYE